MTEFARITVILLLAMNAAAVSARVPPQISAMPAGRRGAMLAAATAVAAGVVALLAVLHGPLLDGLDVEPETFRVAAGVIAAVGGLRVFAAPRRLAPTPGGWAGALTPLAFPLILTPELAVLGVSYAADDGIAKSMAALVAAGVLSCGLTVFLTGRSDAWHRTLIAGTARFIGAVLVVAGVGLVVDGVRSI